MVPFLFLFSPAMLLEGTWTNVAATALTAVGRAFLVSVGVVGYVIQRIGPVSRLLFVADGIALTLPPAMKSDRLVRGQQ
ncbi:MAG: hypothetical protein A3G25_05135 [Betaproteobacteria bacterium RIFCSPLOWO2_12_FULL_63_13]|nr:MAG: hypothetical protein A3H32_01990 [Betaproteobacteria bacterium RIFCSPLOWO2_02_FULL_63_19]OGA53914.1 MAG: hypothetical protein A3G25_05135 [Betaproteobacteria bacterium RIFCSPLOWO2_12_FULL_63_13]